MFNMIPFGRNNPMAKREDFFHQMFNNFFDEDFLAPFTTIGGNGFRVDLKETEDAYLIEADLPGFKKEDISLQYANNYLTVSAKRQETEEKKAENYLRRERHYGEFQRTFYIDNVQDDKISAAFEEGVLTVTLPKQEKTSPQTKQIPIR